MSKKKKAPGIKKSAFVRFCEEQGVKGLPVEEAFALALSRRLSGLWPDATVAVAPRKKGAEMDVVVDIHGRWMWSEFNRIPCLDTIKGAIIIARENYARVNQEAV